MTRPGLSRTTTALFKCRTSHFYHWIVLLIVAFLIAATRKTNADPPAFLLSEDFEGPGFENSGWTKVGAPNADYANTVLHGSESLNCVGAQYIYRTFRSSNSFFMYLQARWNTWSDYNNIIYWDNSAFGFVADLYANHNFFQIAHGSVNTAGTAKITSNTTYHIWFEWTMGTGSNGTVQLFVSTNGIKPSLPDASITNGTGIAIERMYLGPTGPGPDVIFDEVLVSDAPIGHMTEGNQPPSISTIPDQTIVQNSSTGPIPFSIGDFETNAESLVVTGSSSNPTLLPDSNLIFGGSGSNRTVTVTPAADQFGTARVTIGVSDGSLTTSTTFLLTVRSSANSPPVISDIPNKTTVQGTSTAPISFTVGDAETAASSLVVSGTSSNPALVSESSIVFGGSGSNRTVTLTPAPDQFGTATITVTVSDGALTASDSFLLTVTSTNAPAYLLSEDFEGPGFENSGWLKAGSPNADYTNTVLHGSESLNCVGAQYIYRTFRHSNSFFMHLQARWNTWSDYNNIIYWDNSAFGFVADLYANHNFFQIAHGSAFSSGTAKITSNTTYHIWFEWTMGTGSNGTVNLFVSTNGIKPAVPDASISNGTGIATERMYLGPTGPGPDVIFDQVLVSDAPIGHMTEGNQPPSISTIANQSITQNSSTGPIPFTIGDFETNAESLLLTGSSSNPALVSTDNIVFGGSGSNRTVTVTPAPDQVGTASLTVSVSDGSLTTSTSFLLTVRSSGNSPPVISNIPNQTTTQGTPTAPINFTIGDAETAAPGLIVSGTSSNPALVPESSVVFGGSGSNRTVTVTPAANQVGTASLTVSVSDGSLTTSTSFLLTVQSSRNSSPVISNIPNQTTTQGTPPSPINFTIGDAETNAESLLLTGSSSNPALVSESGIAFGGSGSNRTVTVTPAANQFGTTTITVTVSDGALTASDSFLLTINSTNAPRYLLSEDFEGPGFENSGWTKVGAPNADYANTVLHGSESLNCVGAQYIYRTFRSSNSFFMYLQARWNSWSDYNNIIYWDNSAYGFVADLYASHNFFQIAHGSAFTSGTAKITTNTTYHIWFEWTMGTGSNGTVQLFVSTNGIKPSLPDASITNGTGIATERMYLGPTVAGPDVILDRVLVSDVPIGNMSEGNQPPGISNIPDQTIVQNSSTGPIPFSIGDFETNAESLVVTGSSSNPTLLPDSNLIFGGTGSNRTVTATPATDQTGTARVTLRVSDGSLTASRTFLLTVRSSANSPPVISDIPNKTTVAGASTGPISFTVGDAETAASTLLVSGTSSNPTLVPESSIVFGGSGSTRTVTITPAANQLGTATITVTVSDGALTANDSFVLTVNLTNAPIYLLSEDFEGPGFENSGWSKVSTPNGDYTNTVLHGSQSLNCVGRQYIYRTFRYSNSFSMYLLARWNSWSDYNNIIYWDNSAYGFVGDLNASHNFFQIVHGSANAAGTTKITTNTTYHIWFEWTVGTGSNGTAQLFVSTNGIKPSLPDASISNGTGLATERMYLGPTGSGSDIILDQVLVADVPIGNMTEGNQPPSISNVPDQTITQNSSTGPIPFTIGDAETNAQSLLVTGSSSNPTLVAAGNLIFGGSGSNRTVTVTPAPDQFGTATITITVSDGSSSSSDTFTLTVNAPSAKPVLTLAVDDATRLYGAANPLFTGGVSGLQNGDNITATYSTTATPNSPVGTYSIMPVLNDPNNKLAGYIVTTNLGTLTVTSAPLVVTVEDKSRLYGAANPPLTGTLAGVQNGDNLSVTFTTGATSSSPAGNYSITPAVSDPDQKLGNYSLSLREGRLTINPAVLIGKADDKSRPKGEPNPVFTVKYSGFVNGENASIISGTLVSFCPADAGSPPGTYPITVSGQSAPNYSIDFRQGILTVTGFELVIQVNDATRLYGATNPPLAGTVTGLQSGDNITVTYATSATVSSGLGDYPITAVLSDPDNKLPKYEVSLHNGTLTINPATLIGKADDKSRSYGQNNPAFTVSYSGFVNGEDARIVSSRLTASTPADSNSPVGTYPIIVGGQTAPNYTIAFREGTLTVTGAVLSVQVDNLTRTYGAPNPILTGRITGIQNADNITASYTTTATAISPVGIYPIKAVLTDPDEKLSNYNLVLQDGTLTISQAALSVVADDKARTFGTDNPPLTGTLTGVRNGDNITANYSTTATRTSLPGNYPITPALNDPDNTLGNYNVSTTTGTLTVKLLSISLGEPVPDILPILDVRALDKTRPYGAANPSLTGTIAGLQLGDNIVVSYTTVANPASPAGIYTITPVLQDLDGILSNYKLTTQNAALTVTPVVLNVSADDKIRPYGAANPIFTGAITGLQNGDSVIATYTTKATPETRPGAYPITPQIDPNGQLGNYVLRLRHGLLLVKSSAAITITSITRSDDHNIRIIGTGDPGVRFTIQTSIDLIHWEDIGATAADDTGRFVFETLESDSQVCRFFRAYLP